MPSISDVIRALVKLEDKQVVCVLTRRDDSEDAQHARLDVESPVVRMIGKLGYLGNNIYDITDGKNELRFNCHMVEHISPITVTGPAVIYLSWQE